MVTQAHVDWLTDAESLISTEPTDGEVARVAAQIEAEGLDTPLVVYPDGAFDAVVDDGLRLRAIQRLHHAGRLPGSAQGGWIPVHRMISRSEAIRTAADRVIRAQRGPVEEVIYVKGLLTEQAKSGSNAFGVRYRSDGQTCPPEQQPGPVGWLSQRFGFTPEWARQTNHGARIPEPVLQACLGQPKMTKARLVRAGRRINDNPEADPEAIARAELFDEPGTTAESNAHGDDTTEETAKATANTGPVIQSQQKTPDRDVGLSATTPSGLAWQTTDILTNWQSADQQAFWTYLVAFLLDRDDADPHALIKALQDAPARAGLKLGEQLMASMAPATAPAEPAPDRTAEALEETGNTSCRRSARADDCHSPAAAATKAGGGPGADGARPANDAAGAVAGEVDPGGGSVAHGAQTASTAIGQSNDGPRGGVCDEREAEAYRAKVRRLKDQYGTQADLAKAAGIPQACVSALLNGRGLSRAKADKLDQLSCP